MIILKSQSELVKMRKAGRMVAEVLQLLRERIRPGVTTLELNRLAEDRCKKWKARPAFKGYGGFPFTICASINDEVVHGIPSPKRALKEGDIVGVDCGTSLEGYFGDAAVTFAVGNISDDAARLMKETKASLDAAIDKVKVGNRLSDISNAVQSHVEARGYSVVRNFVGHGIGKSLHEEPQIPNFGSPGHGIRLRAGMVFAIEPMINMGKKEVMVLDDGWTAVTNDGSLSAHFEHSVAVTENGPYILSQI
ncbi:MAG: type I methionyl aminopeptidase [Desulfuromonadales bacterium]|nr:type I methionyl aminopeptidase [Desulfuromonadales bacterium]